MRRVVLACWALAIAAAFLAGGGFTYRGEVLRGGLSVALIAIGCLGALAIPPAAGFRVRVNQWHGLWLAAVIYLALATQLGSGGYLGLFQASEMAAFLVLAVMLTSHPERLALHLPLRTVAASLIGLTLVAGAGHFLDVQPPGLRSPLPESPMRSDPTALVAVAALALPLLAAMFWIDRRGRFLYGSAAAGAAVLLAAGTCSLAHPAIGTDCPGSFLRRATLDSLSEGAGPFLFGRGLDSLSRKLHGVSPADHGFTCRRGSFEYADSGILGWWHDGGILLVLALVTLIAVTVAAQVRTARSASTSSEQRVLSVALLASLSLWVLLGATGAAARDTAVQLLFALILCLSWRITELPHRELSSRPAVAALSAIAVLSASFTLPYVVSERLLLQASRERNGAGSAILSEAALRWKPGNPDALYLLLERASERGDLGSTLELHRRLTPLAPSYLYADSILGMALLRSGRLREAAEAFEAFQAVAPFDYGPALNLPYLAIQLGDRALLERSLQKLLVYAIRELNGREARSIDVEEMSYAGGPAIGIYWNDGRSSVTVPVAGLAGVLLGGQPPGLAESRKMLAIGLNGFLRRELGARTDIIPASDVQGAISPRYRKGSVGFRSLDSGPPVEHPRE
jgi:hypothetical protein